MRVSGRVQDPNGQVQELLQTVQITLEAIELHPWYNKNQVHPQLQPQLQPQLCLNFHWQACSILTTSALVGSDYPGASKELIARKAIRYNYRRM